MNKMPGVSDIVTSQMSDASYSRQSMRVIEVLSSLNYLTNKKLKGVHNYQQWQIIVYLALLSREGNH